MSAATAKPLLAFLIFLASGSAALGQAGSTGGTIGKQDKSISGGEEAARPHAASPAKRPAANTRETSGDSCGKIVGTWIWYRGVSETVFDQSGAMRNTFNTGRWTCAGAAIRAKWATGDTESYTLSPDGSSMSVVSTWNGGVRFTATRRN